MIGLENKTNYGEINTENASKISEACDYEGQIDIIYQNLKLYARCDNACEVIYEIHGEIKKEKSYLVPVWGNHKKAWSMTISYENFSDIVWNNVYNNVPFSFKIVELCRDENLMFLAYPPKNTHKNLPDDEDWDTFTKYNDEDFGAYFVDADADNYYTPRIMENCKPLNV